MEEEGQEEEEESTGVESGRRGNAYAGFGGVELALLSLGMGEKGWEIGGTAWMAGGAECRFGGVIR